MGSTTIKLSGETKNLLDMVRSSGRQTYDELIKELIEERIESHLELKPEIKRQVLKNAQDLKSGKLKALSFEEAYEKAYG